MHVSLTACFQLSYFQTRHQTSWATGSVSAALSCLLAYVWTSTEQLLKKEKVLNQFVSLDLQSASYPVRFSSLGFLEGFLVKLCGKVKVVILLVMTLEIFWKGFLLLLWGVLPVY